MMQCKVTWLSQLGQSRIPLAFFVFRLVIRFRFLWGDAEKLDASSKES
jgi:hypothetical protein